MLFDDNKLYTPQEVMKAAKIGKSLFDILVKDETIPVIRISKRVRRCKGASLNRVFSEQ